VRASKKRVPGYGHPTHKGDDFRATKLWKIAKETGFIGEKTKLYQAIHAEFVRVTGKKDICINVDGALACIMVEMGFRPLQMVSVAILAVLPGIFAHVIEEIEEGKPLRIVRDEDQDYIGLPERPLPKNMIEVNDRLAELRYGNRLRQDKSHAETINALVCTVESLSALVPDDKLDDNSGYFSVKVKLNENSLASAHMAIKQN